ncbi:MAG TPA: hypothetical protein PLI05_06105 [Methanotrichaceae archaeon]|nr:hypothetical protein [Methanotrichaceae archaeon]HQI91256.1 hypothetical protein [Methanotrichaceae archaeon]
MRPLMRITTLLAAPLLLAAISAQAGVVVPVTGAQPVGGEFAQGWLEEFLKYNEPPTKSEKNMQLWNWGNIPKGKTLKDGKLVDDDRTYNLTNISADWLGERPLGQPVWLNRSNYDSAAVLSPLYLSDDPWIRAQQLGQVIRTPRNYWVLT